MSIAYPVLYRLGLDWWEDNDDTGPLPQLVAARPAGVALDAGCGTGRHAVWLAEQGWTVVGVDAVERPLREARARAEEAGVADRARFVKDDVAGLSRVPTDAPYDLVVDIGCFHGLRADHRAAFAEWVTRNTRQGAAVVIHAVEPRSGIGPSGVGRESLGESFGPAWSIETTPSTTRGGGPLRHASFRWFTLSRSAAATAESEDARP